MQCHGMTATLRTLLVRQANETRHRPSSFHPLLSIALRCMSSSTTAPTFQSIRIIILLVDSSFVFPHLLASDNLRRRQPGRLTSRVLPLIGPSAVAAAVGELITMPRCSLSQLAARFTRRCLPSVSASFLCAHSCLSVHQHATEEPCLGERPVNVRSTTAACPSFCGASRGG